MDELATDGTVLRSLPHRAGAYLWPRSISPDGRALLFEAPEKVSRESADLRVISLQGDSTATVVAGGESNQTLAQFSPDGRYFAYGSGESGQGEVFVATYPGGGKWQVSQDGGAEPRWRGDGRELYYVDRSNYIVAVEVNPGATAFEPGSTARLFQFHGAGGNWRYDVNVDGTRFLVTRALEEDLASPVTLITDWTRKLERR
jgi:dipeptidyl aminopeptidase/acylaminoacyl peptidase